MQKRIMIFDDEEASVEIVRVVLEWEGWDVFASFNCDDMIEQVGRVKPDVIIMNHCIPPTGGISATQTVKRHTKFNAIPVIYFSAIDKIESLAKEAGADTYLEKPFNIADLVDKAGEMLERKVKIKE